MGGFFFHYKKIWRFLHNNPFGRCVMCRDAHPRNFIEKEMRKMKNKSKKISALAMAFALLSTGTAISHISPRTSNVLTAQAANNDIETARNGINALCDMGNAAGTAQTAGSKGIFAAIISFFTPTAYDIVKVEANKLLDGIDNRYSTYNAVLDEVGLR